MIERRVEGEVPKKHHIALRAPGGTLRHEECFTRGGFDGPYTILYHLDRPHTHQPMAMERVPSSFEEADAVPLAKRHFQTAALGPLGGPPWRARRPLLANDDVRIGVAEPDAEDEHYVVRGDGDDLVFVLEGGGVLRSPMGDLRFGPLDYVAVPRGMPHRFIPERGQPQRWLCIETLGGLHLPRQWRNESGQLRMDAPYCHRDFRAPTFAGPVDEGLRTLAVERGGSWSGFRVEHSPLDVVGWDGSVYPFVFHILDFQPRVGLVHLPPTWHGTFATRGALICSFVPRPVDFHNEAIPCPYPHTSVDCDEVLYYARGNFTSRRGVGPGSVSLHPAGIPHGPHPGAYERSIGHSRTDELAVMVDTFAPLRVSRFAASVEDAGYMQSFLA